MNTIQQSLLLTPCAGENDRSPDPIQGVLPQVIEATNRVIVSNADWDGLLLTNGTLLSIQNMTWHGKLGFQSPITDDFVVDLRDKE
jgi:carboxypeptidase D